MLYSIENTEIFFKLTDERVAEELDALLVMAEMMDIRIDYTSYDTPFDESAIVFNSMQKIEFIVSPIGYLSRVEIFSYKEPEGIYHHKQLLEGIRHITRLVIEDKGSKE